MPRPRIGKVPENFEARRADDEAAAIAVERIRSGDADLKEDGAEALAKLGLADQGQAASKKP